MLILSIDPGRCNTACVMVDTAFTPPRVIEAELIYFCNGSTSLHQMMRVFAKKFPTYTRTLANPLSKNHIVFQK
jgi:hypothetical protein